MPRPIPYVFCRYQISVDEEILGLSGQRQFLQEAQGDLTQHGRVRGDLPQAATLVMEPSEFEFDGSTCLSWSVGLRPGFRIQTEYNKERERMTQKLVDDPHIRFAPIIAIPSLGVMAIEDRVNDERIGAKQAIGAFRSIVRSWGEETGSFEVHQGDPTDIERWLNEWELKEFSFTITPLNPISASDLAERRSDAMKRENVDHEAGTVRPAAGKSMQANGGVIEEANELANVGYGQRGFRGQTPDGHVAHVPKPKFHHDRQKNLAEQEKPQFVRVMFERTDDASFLGDEIAGALRRFYGHRDG